MKYFFDTEFLAEGNLLDLISIGIVAEDGREFYRENRAIDIATLPEWLQKNVVPNLTGTDMESLAGIREDLLEFIGDDEPEFWGYFVSYDWVALCGLFGQMIDLPKIWPMFPRDVQIVRMQLGGVPLPRHSGALHNALEDARWTKEVYDYLCELAVEVNCYPLLFR